METFKCRSIKPNISRWFEVKAESYGEAIQSIHNSYVPNISSNCGIINDVIKSIVYDKRENDDSSECIYFSLIEVEGHGEFVSRIYYKGIRRKGGFRPKKQITLQDIAAILNWKHAPEELLNDNWEAEETCYRNCAGDIV